ncbi:unnamed protein product, partial [Ixodes hexagonus]
DAAVSVATTLPNNSYFVPPDFPRPYAGGKNVSLTVTLPAGICQARLELEQLALQPPQLGVCSQDYLQVSLNGSDTYVPKLCGENSGQHVVLHTGDAEENSLLTLKVSLRERGPERVWAIRIVLFAYLDVATLCPLAPQGCLQFHRGCRGSFRSFGFTEDSLAETLKGLSYAMCIARPIWLQALSLKLRTLSTASPSTVPAAHCQSDFLQLPAGFDSERGLATPVRLCEGNATLVLHLSVQGPLVFYVVSGQTSNPSTQFEIAYSLYPCSFR